MDYTAFVAMPMLEDYQEGLTILDRLKQLGAHAGFDVVRVDEIDHTRKITDVMIGIIHQADLLIVDVTMSRPNVYYELGYAHALGKPALVICRTGEELHFDIKDYKVHYYRDKDDLGSLVIRTLVAIRQDIEALKEPPEAIILRDKLSEMRSHIGTSLMALDDNGREINELPAGVFGFTTSWQIDGLLRHADRVALYPETGGTITLEVHLLPDGKIGLVLYSSEMNVDAPATLSVTSDPGLFGEPVFVPIDNIHTVRRRSVRGHDVYDITWRHHNETRPNR